ncbi:MAG: DUF1549 domain-containing protein [Acidimicrobiia bacterium]|nr:DUF1549 domain-containing protein [Acidimicrobiia bacterium]
MPRLTPTFFLLALALQAQTPGDFFEMKVRPVLASQCFACHNTAKMGGLELTSREALMRGGNTGPAVRPGDPDSSLLIQAVRQTHERFKMPPTGKLKPAEIEALATWIRDGAHWPEAVRAKPAEKWWAFQPVTKPSPPAVKNIAWARTPIDRFLLARLEAEKLQPAPPADRRTLIRRATYDLTGLPPTPEQVDAFLADRSPDAFAKVVDRLLAAPHYGERWGRYWLDIARYSDDKLNSTQDEPVDNVWRYRDWVIQAFNDDMPYDQFVKAQLAGDLMQPRERYIAGLGLFANNPNFQEDRVDALSRGLLGLTVACAQCHDHKFDPIPTRDYYSLLGVFESTKSAQHPLVSKDIVDRYQSLKKTADDQQKKVTEFENRQASQLAEILATHAALYLKAARTGAPDPSLDNETLERWKKYLAADSHEHPFLKGWRDASFDDGAFQKKLLAVIARKHEIDQENFIRTGGKDDNRTVRVIEVLSLERDDYFLWRDIVSGERHRGFESGIYFYKAAKLDRFLAPHWKQHLDALRAELDRRKKEVPEQYPYLLTIQDIGKPKNLRVYIRGDRENLGEEAPRQFLSVLSNGEPKPFTNGSGRLELAESIIDPANPLTARVIANRVWMYHFGRPIVATPGNFGRLAETPTHPELLDYLAARLIEHNWSLKKLHREIMLSSAYSLSAASKEPNATADPENKLLWRAHRRRLDVEPMRDTLLFLSGELDTTSGGAAQRLNEANHLRRTVYGFVSRRRLDGTLSLFDFPNPVSTSDGRIHTATPLQQLYFLNSQFIQARAEALFKRLESAGDNRARIRAAYRLLFQRAPLDAETKLGLGYLASNPWPQYVQALLSSNELLFID